MNSVTWLDKNEYPFGRRFVNVDGHKMHYIDEGMGETILFVHGIPDWSFGWRNVIKNLSEYYRCVAIDHLGAGLSDKPDDVDLSVNGHAERLARFVERTGLKNIHLVVHDFGGPIGLSYAVEHSDNIKSITAFNTWMWPLNGIKHFETGAKLVNTAFGKWLYLSLNFSVRFMLKNSYADHKNLPGNIYKHYLKAQEEKNARLATYTLAKALTGEPVHMQYLWNSRNKLQHIPIQIAWGMKDKFVPADILLQKWSDAFTQIEIKHIANAGHFVQEEAPEQLSKAIAAIIAESKRNYTRA